MAEEFKAIVNKVSEGLNFFDFSFFVSGFMTFVVLCYSVNVLFYRIIYFSTFVDYLVAIVLIYISGVISFVSGKFLRNKIRKRQEVDEAPTKWYHIRSFKYIYVETLTHLNMPQIDGVSFTDPSLAYSQMWIVIRQKDTSGKCYQDLYRQWVMQAVCEGLFFSFLLSLVFSITLPIIIRKTKCYRFIKRNVLKRKTKRLRYRCPPEPYSNSVRTDFFSYSNAIILESQQINTSI